MQKNYHYATNCVNAGEVDILEMVEKARAISYTTFSRNCSGLREFARDMGYDRMGLTLKGDWHISYYKSTYQGKPCYYLVHSCIEYIWVLA